MIPYKKSIYYYLFLSVAILYGILIVYNANLSVIDDHTLLNTILKGEKIPLFIIPEIGRFFPLAGFELNIISLFSLSPTAFYIFNSFQFIVLVFLFYKMIYKIGGKDRINLSILTILILILTPGFVTAWLRLFVPERNVLFFLTIFLFFFLKYQETSKIQYAIYAVLSANIALYYKEPVFIMLGSFAFFYLLFGWRENNIQQKILNFLLIVSSLIFFLLYFFIVYLNRGDVLYGKTNINYFIQFFKIAFNYALSDPVLILIVLPLAIYRTYVIIKSRKAQPLYDSLLFSSVIYVLIFFKLNIFSYHYLLPAYIFGIFGSFYYIVNEGLYKKLIIKLLLFLSLIFLVFSSLPNSLHLISHYKNVPNNYQKTLDFLRNYISAEYNKGYRTSIFLDGVNRNTGVEIYHSFIKFLEYKGLTPVQFDMKTNEDDNNILAFVKRDKNSPYTVEKQANSSQLMCGDLVIVSPYTTKYIDLKKSEINKMNKDFDLLFKTNSFMEIPNLGIKSLVKYLFIKKRYLEDKSGAILFKNIFGLPLDFYVFKMKCKNERNQ